MYSDVTTCDYLGKTSEYVYLTLGNISSWFRNKPDAKVLLRYLPQLKIKTISEKRSKNFRSTNHILYKYTLDILMQSLLDYKNNGFDL